MLTRPDLANAAHGLRVAAAALEQEAREEGPESARFDALVRQAASFRRTRARALRQARA